MSDIPTGKPDLSVLAWIVFHVQILGDKRTRYVSIPTDSRVDVDWMANSLIQHKIVDQAARQILPDANEDTEFEVLQWWLLSDPDHKRILPAENAVRWAQVEGIPPVD